MFVTYFPLRYFRDLDLQSSSQDEGINVIVWLSVAEKGLVYTFFNNVVIFQRKDQMYNTYRNIYDVKVCLRLGHSMHTFDFLHGCSVKVCVTVFNDLLCLEVLGRTVILAL